jgi:hypothetical protein
MSRHVVASAIALLAPFAAAAPACLGAELLRNGNAEEGPGATANDGTIAIPGWETAGRMTALLYGRPGWPTPEEAARIGGGSNFFTGGYLEPVSTATQVVSVAGEAAGIDADTREVALRGHLGTYRDGDEPSVEAFFLGDAGQTLGAVAIRLVDPLPPQNTFVLREATARVPVGTRSIRVVVTSKRQGGESNDGYSDNVSLDMRPVAAPIPPPPVTPPPPPLTPPPTPPVSPSPPPSPAPFGGVVVNLQVTIPAPQVVIVGPTQARVPGRISLRSIKRSRCIRVVVKTSRPARVLATIFSGRRSLRLFGQREVVFFRPGQRIVCIMVPRRAQTFNVRTPLRFALGYRLGTARPRPGTPAPRPVIRTIRLVP